MSLSTLPAEIQLQILSFLDHRSLIKMASTNRYFCLLPTDDDWKKSLLQFLKSLFELNDYRGCEECRIIIAWLKSVCSTLKKHGYKTTMKSCPALYESIASAARPRKCPLLVCQLHSSQDSDQVTDNWQFPQKTIKEEAIRKPTQT